MTNDMASTPEERVVALWRLLGNSAIGRYFYSFLFCRMVPYTGTIRPMIEQITPGRASVVIKDRRVLRNHLHSIHAIALANVGELASGLAVIAALPKATKGIVTHLEIDYTKKARGRLTAIGEAQVPEIISNSITILANATILDAGGDSVATVTTQWLLGPRD